MKRSAITAAVLALVAILLLQLTPMAATYSWQEGVVPEDWSRIVLPEEVTAEHILAPVNPHASQEAKNLYAYLCTLVDSQQLLSGTFDITTSDKVYQEIKNEFGSETALYSNRYEVNVDAPVFDAEGQLTSQTFTFTNVPEANALLKAHYDNNNVLLVHSDWGADNVCGGMAVRSGKYESSADAIAELDRTNPERDMQIYAIWMLYQRNLIAALQQLEDSGVKAYLWRPWVEFNYQPFTGMTEEGFDHFVRVFQQTVQDMMDSGLEGFLVTYSPGATFDTLERNPGNDYVDVYGATMYSDDNLGKLRTQPFPNYDWYVRTGKPMGFTELSCRTGNWVKMGTQPRGNWLDTLFDIETYWPGICFVDCWSDGPYSLVNSGGDANGNDNGQLFMDSPFTLTREDVPAYRTGILAAPGVAQTFGTGDGSGLYTGLEEKLYSAAELRALGLTLSSVRSLRLNTGYGLTFYSGEDGTGDFWGYGASVNGLTPAVAAQFRSLKVERIVNRALEKDIYASNNDAEAFKANDGIASVWRGQLQNGAAWLMVDLGAPCTVTQYVLKNAGYAGQLSAYNTRDFQLQYSNDGETWTAADTVQNNTLDILSRSVEPFTARYVRLYITGANSIPADGAAFDRNLVTVCELEILGVQAGKASTVSVKPLPEPDTSHDTEEPNAEPEDSVIQPDTSDAEPDDVQPDDDTPTPSKRRRVLRQTTQSFFPWWGWVLIAAGVLLAAGATVLLLLRKKRRKDDGTKGV